jgi:hypothetical protein
LRRVVVWRVQYAFERAELKLRLVHEHGLHL